MEYGSVMAGQVSAMVKEIKPAAEIIKEITEQARKIIDEFHKRAVNKP